MGIVVHAPHGARAAFLLSSVPVSFGTAAGHAHARLGFFKLPLMSERGRLPSVALHDPRHDHHAARKRALDLRIGLNRRIESKQLRAAFHDPEQTCDRRYIALHGGRPERNGHIVKPSCVKLSQLVGGRSQRCSRAPRDCVVDGVPRSIADLPGDALQCVAACPQLESSGGALRGLHSTSGCLPTRAARPCFLTDVVYGLFKSGPRFGRRYARAVRERSRPKPVDQAPVWALQAEVANLVQAIAGGLNSPAVTSRLAEAEAELTRLQEYVEPSPRASISRLIPRIADEYRGLVARLADTIHETDPARGRAVIRELVGEGRVQVDEQEIRLISRETGIEEALARAAGAPLQIKLVAGAGFEPATFGL